MNDVSSSRYIVATIKPWNVDAFHRHAASLPGDWYLATERDELEALLKRYPDVRYIFFPHWSWVVPESVTDSIECVCFHMTDVPYGRGGSPLQNLIQRGHKETQLTALRMVRELDAGPVYGKLPLSLDGSAEEIYTRQAELCYELVRVIINEEIDPVPQEGKVTLFERRTPEQSRVPDGLDPEELYDFIRMLDAPTYPKAFIEQGGYRIELSKASLSGDGVTAEVRIHPR